MISDTKTPTQTENFKVFISGAALAGAEAPSINATSRDLLPSSPGVSRGFHVAGIEDAW
ncbi:MAG: hypothetical protein WC539_07040 [Nitrospirota bacterium]